VYSINLDYIFDKAYDFLLWFKYSWNFWVLGISKEAYLKGVDGEVYDGLRDRGWLDEMPEGDGTKFNFFGLFDGGDKIDSDGDGIMNNQDPYPNDPNNFSKAQLLEIYDKDLGWTDKLRVFFGFDLRDEDGDGLPDTVEAKKGTDRLVVDSDHDGLSDGEEVFRGYNPMSSDTDKDLIIDGRDAYPLDPYRTYFENDGDVDGDGIGDRFEQSIGTDPNIRDTDNDGYPDGFDSYPLDPKNVANANTIGVSDLTNGLIFHIQNPFLSFISDVISVLTLFLLPLSILIIIKWIMIFRDGANHYYHMFHSAPGYFDVFAKQSHKDTHNDHSKNPEVTHSSEENIGITHIQKPERVEYKQHPRWAIVEDYLSADREDLWRIGILEADNLLSDTLRARGYPGQDLGEMLLNADFASINDAWEAHKIRNKIAHEGVAYTLTAHTAAKAFNAYKNVFLEFKII
jgi:hypothetical protein